MAHLLVGDCDGRADGGGVGRRGGQRGVLPRAPDQSTDVPRQTSQSIAWSLQRVGTVEVVPSPLQGCWRPDWTQWSLVGDRPAAIADTAMPRAMSLGTRGGSAPPSPSAEPVDIVVGQWNRFHRPFPRPRVGVRDRDGDHVTIFSGTRLVREFTADRSANTNAATIPTQPTEPSTQTDATSATTFRDNTTPHRWCANAAADGADAVAAHNGIDPSEHHCRAGGVVRRSVRRRGNPDWGRCHRLGRRRCRCR